MNKNRYSAARCFIQAIDVGSLIIEKPCHFGVVSFKVGTCDTSYETFDECGSRNVECGRMASLRSVSLS